MRSQVASMMVVLVLAALATGCEDSSSQPAADTSGQDAGPNEALMDKNIVQAVRSARQQPPAAPSAVDGPPPGGVFGPGLADKAHPAGAPAAIELLGEGDTPRVSLRPTAKANKGRRLVITVGKRLGNQVMPNVDYALVVRLEPGKGGGDSAATEKAAADLGGATLVVKVKSARPSAQQPGQLPAGLDKHIAKLADSRITAQVAASGALGPAKITLPDKTPAELGELIQTLSEVLSLMVSPMPAKAVGASGYWIADDRAVSSRMQVVRYRVLRVEQLTGTQAVLSLDLRQYAASAQAVPLGAPPGLQVGVLNAAGKGSFAVQAGEIVPRSGQLKVSLSMQLSDPKQPGRAAPIKIETVAQIQQPPADKGSAAQKVVRQRTAQRLGRGGRGHRRARAIVPAGSAF